MKILSLILFSFCSSIICAQKFEQIKDKFTGKVTNYTKFETIYRSMGAVGDAGERVQFSYFKFNDSLFFYLGIRKGGNSIIQVGQGQSLQIKFSGTGGTTILSAYQNQVSKIEPAASVNATYISVLYFLDPEVTNKMRSTDIEAIRMEHAAGSLEWDIKGKYSSLPRKTLTK